MSVILQKPVSTEGIMRAIVEPVWRMVKLLSNNMWKGKTLQKVAGLIFGSENRNICLYNKVRLNNRSCFFIEKNGSGAGTKAGEGLTYKLSFRFRRFIIRYYSGARLFRYQELYMIRFLFWFNYFNFYFGSV